MIAFTPDVAKADDFLPPAPSQRSSVSALPLTPSAGSADIQSKVEEVIRYVEANGFIFDPWQIATFISAVRTKPFIVLAGISGTGKTKLPRLVANATGAEVIVVPVKPDWTDSSELLGYQRINGDFVPGSLLRFAKKAFENPDQQFFFVLDEMNIARVEYYLAEILSHIEERKDDGTGRLVSEPLMEHILDPSDPWSTVRFPENLCLVGSVNMDETTHGFSRKVLDRSFVIEFSTIDLSNLGNRSPLPVTTTWSRLDWRALATQLVTHPANGSADVADIIDVLVGINTFLEPAQLQIGYRVRDEIAMFCLSAQGCLASFITLDSGAVDPLDIAISMKILPRIQGGGNSIKVVLKNLYGWATACEDGSSERRGTAKSFPFSAERIEMMTKRLKETGFTSYWL
jgi:hypothetical protein